MTRRATITLIATILFIAFAPLAPNGIFGPFTPSTLQQFNISIVDILLLVVVITLWLLLPTVIGKQKKSSPIIFIFITLLLIWSFIAGDSQLHSLLVTSRFALVIWLTYLLNLWVPQWGRYNTSLLIISIILIQSVWAITQFSIQSDLNLYPLGETRLQPLRPGIATVTINTPDHNKLIRAYGPYHHPNSLAGAIVIALILLSVISRKSKSTIAPRPALTKIYFYAPLIIALLTTLSRATLLATLILIFIHNLIQRKKNYSFSSVTWATRKIALLIVVILLVFTPILLSRNLDHTDRAVPERVSAASYSLQLIRSHPIYRGFGPGNYAANLKQHLDDNHIVYSDWEIAPVHNVPLLLIAELGLLPFIAIAALLIYQISQAMPRTWPYLITLLPVLFLDHYPLTQTAPLILLVCLAVLLAKHSLHPPQPPRHSAARPTLHISEP